VKEVDDTPVNESKSEIDLVSERLLETICALLYPQVAAFMEIEMHSIIGRIVELEHALALLQEERVTIRPPEATDDPEWYS
jgi:hypothetical protein